MKVLRTIIVALALMATLGSTAQDLDSVDISLVTCGPGREIYSQYGHTAIRVHDRRSGQDLAINYGMFSSHQPWFVLRFIFGLTDYRVDAVPFDLFLEEYREEGRSVVEQVLRLTDGDKQRILSGLADNLRPENQEYRYNFFFDNCSTRPRDMIVDNLGGHFRYTNGVDGSRSFRRIIHEWNRDYPWTQFGEDLLLGFKADAATTRADQQFLPRKLEADFDSATIDGRPLVERRMEILPEVQTGQGSDGLPLPGPRTELWSFFVISAIVAVWELKRGRVCVWWDAVLMVLTTVPGIILTLLLFSQHPCVNPNLLLLWLNPLPLFVGWYLIRRSIRIAGGQTQQHCSRWWLVQLALVVLGFVGAAWQTYPAGMAALALSLLLRPVVHLQIEKLK